ncbi:unnamed protein product [Leptidea sinapis]|uniref:Uncharacterized protein n=1 Tax=Leptidea sinapis TaxID=189913 RepID=A0A5E4QV70_9NEOP|nr:unnamed protein product [Leptidea sinapis]
MMNPQCRLPYVECGRRRRDANRTELIRPGGQGGGMRGEANGARAKAAGRTNYPPISAAYWLPPSNPTPYHIPGSLITYHSYQLPHSEKS